MDLHADARLAAHRLAGRRPASRRGWAAEQERLADLAAVAYSAELLGIAQRSLDLSVGYAKERVQFGRPIGSFQAVKHRCADMLVDVEGMRSASTGRPGASPPATTTRRSPRRPRRLVQRRVEPGHRVGAAGARRHRLHLGARHPPLPEARPPRRALVVRRCHRAPCAARRPLRQRIDAGESVI